MTNETRLNVIDLLHLCWLKPSTVPALAKRLGAGQETIRRWFRRAHDLGARVRVRVGENGQKTYSAGLRDLAAVDHPLGQCVETAA